MALKSTIPRQIFYLTGMMIVLVVVLEVLAHWGL